MTISRVGRRRRLARGGVAAGVVALAAFATAPPAAATTYDEASWYYTNFGMAANLAVTDGTGTTIALIDGSIDPAVPELANAKITPHPSMCLLNGSSDPVNATTDATHGTQMAVLIASNGTGNWDGRGGRGIAPGATVLHYRNSTDKADGSGTECRDASGDAVYDEATAASITDAVAQGARVVNMSFGTEGDMPRTAAAIGAGERQGVVFVGATYDKDKATTSDRVVNPGAYNGVVLMNGLTATSQLAPNSSTSPLVTLLAPGDDVVVGGINPATGQWDSSGVFGGSSMAAAFTSAVIADAMSHYPGATGNQIIQLLLRTTGGSFHEIPTRAADGFGFGTVSLTTMLEHDPRQLPDVNPLLRDGAEPSSASITGQDTSAPSADPSTTTTSAAPSRTPGPAAPVAAGPAASSSLLTWLPVAAAALVVVGALVVVVVLVRRSRRRPPGGPTPPAPGGWGGPATTPPWPPPGP